MHPFICILLVVLWLLSFGCFSNHQELHGAFSTNFLDVKRMEADPCVSTHTTWRGNVSTKACPRSAHSLVWGINCRFPFLWIAIQKGETPGRYALSTWRKRRGGPMFGSGARPVWRVTYCLNMLCQKQDEITQNQKEIMFMEVPRAVLRVLPWHAFTTHNHVSIFCAYFTMLFTSTLSALCTHTGFCAEF